MTQMPARDFIRDAVVDFRFHGGEARNYANNSNALVWSSNAPIIQAAHGVKALAYCDGGAPQSWMVATQSAVTIEFLISMDMYYLGEVASPASTMQLLSGDWQVGLSYTPGAGFTSIPGLYASFNGASFGSDYYIEQPFASAAIAQSLYKGSMLHVVMSAEYVADTSMTVVTQVNGVYDDIFTTDFTNHNMTPAPTNTLFDIASSIPCPIYLFRMWDEYTEDALMLADLYREARKIVPFGSFHTVAANELTFMAPS